MPEMEYSHQDAVVFLRELSSTHQLQFNLNKMDFIASCRARNVDDKTLNMIRDDLFVATQVSGLSDKRACLITRRATSLHPLGKKLIDDIWYLADCIYSRRNVKRVMYKSGKRCAEYLEEKLSSNITLVSQLPFLSSQETQTRTPLNTSVHLDGEKSSNTHTLQEDSHSLTNCNQATATTMESEQSTDDVQATDVLSTRDLVRKVVTLESHICQLRKELCIVSKSNMLCIVTSMSHPEAQLAA